MRADDAGEDDSPPVAMEAVGDGDGYGAEQDAHAEAGQAHVVGGDVLLERLYECRCDEGDDAGRRDWSAGWTGYCVTRGGGEWSAHCPASGSSSSLAGPSSRRSLRFTRHMSTQVMAMITSVAEKMSGVRNEL